MDSSDISGPDISGPDISGPGLSGPGLADPDLTGLAQSEPDLSELIRPRPTESPLRFTLDVPEGLRQGRGAWGGVATGAIVAAAQLVDPRPEMAVRTLGAQLLAPVPVGRLHIIVEELRRGSATNTLGLRGLDEDGSLLAHGVVVLGARRSGDAIPDGPSWLSVEPPRELTAGPEAVPVVALGPPLAPEFMEHLEIRPISGIPYQAAGVDETRGWVRPRGAVARIDASVVCALADAWWVSVMARLDRPRPVATLGFTLDLPFDPADLQRDAEGRIEALFHRGRSVAARDGFTVEVRELWTRAGRLVSWNTQTVAVIK